DHLARRNDSLAGEMAAALGPDLVLDRDRREPCALEGAGDKVNVQRIAIAGVGVGEEGNARAGGELLASPQVLVEGENAAVGKAKQAFGEARAADRGGLIAEPLDQPHAVAVEHAGKNQDLLGFDQRSKGAAIRHGVPPKVARPVSTRASVSSSACTV